MAFRQQAPSVTACEDQNPSTVMRVSLEAGPSPVESDLTATPANTLSPVFHETSSKKSQLSHAWIPELHKLRS